MSGRGGITYAQVLKQVLGLGVDLQLARLGVLGEVEGGDLGDVLVLALTLLLLQLEGDAADGALLDTLHQVGGVAGDLVAQALGGDDGDLIADSLVGVEVEGQLGVEPLDDDFGGFLNCLCANATHFGGVGGVLRMVVVVDGEKGKFLGRWTSGWVETSIKKTKADQNSWLPTLGC